MNDPSSRTQALRQRQAAAEAAHAAGLGVLVDRRHRAVARSGAAADTLLIAGPLARGTFGELMGLPQVSRDAELVAAEILARLDPVWTAGSGGWSTRAGPRAPERSFTDARPAASG